MATEGVDISVYGVKEIQQALSNLAHKDAKKAMRKGLKAGAKLIQQQAKANAPQKTGALKRSLKARVGRSRGDSVVVIVGSGKKWFVGDTFYAAFQEFGWSHGKRPSRFKKATEGDTRKEVEGKHFVEQAYDTTKQTALTTAIDATKKAIDEIVDKNEPLFRGLPK